MLIVTQIREKKRNEARARPLKSQSWGMQKITNRQWPAPINSIHNLIREYTAYALLQLVSRSTEVSKGYAVLDVKERQVSQPKWIGELVDTETVVSQVVGCTMKWGCFDITTRNIHRRSFIQSTKMVNSCNNNSPTLHSESHKDSCSWLQHFIAVVLCAPILRCAVMYAELAIRSPILGHGIQFECIFVPYCKHKEERLKDFIPNLRKRIARRHDIYENDTQNGENPTTRHNHSNIFEHNERSIDHETKSYMSWADIQTF